MSGREVHGARSYTETNQHNNLPWNFISHGFLDPSAFPDFLLTRITYLWCSHLGHQNARAWPASFIRSALFLRCVSTPGMEAIDTTWIWTSTFTILRRQIFSRMQWPCLFLFSKTSVLWREVPSKIFQSLHNCSPQHISERSAQSGHWHTREGTLTWVVGGRHLYHASITG